MATAGGLEIHVEMFHATAPAPPPDVYQSEVDAEPVESEPYAVPERAAVPAKPAASVLRGYDATVPLTALLVLTLLVAGIGSAVRRSTTSAHPALASIASGSSSSEDVTPTTVAPVLPAPAPSAPSPNGSPAAIPPAGSQPAAAAQNSICGELVDSLSNRNAKRNVDIGELIRTNTFPALPLPGFGHPTVADLGHYATVEDYLAARSSPAGTTVAQAQQLLLQSGFVGADSVEFMNAGSSYGAVVLRFTTSAGARAFNRGTLLAACNSGVLSNPAVMPTLSGGLNYLLNVGSPFRATFVAGDTVVRLSICTCVQAPDDQVLAGQWAQAVAAHVGAA